MALARVDALRLLRSIEDGCRQARTALERSSRSKNRIRLALNITVLIANTTVSSTLWSKLATDSSAPSLEYAGLLLSTLGVLIGSVVTITGLSSAAENDLAAAVEFLAAGQRARWLRLTLPSDDV